MFKFPTFLVLSLLFINHLQAQTGSVAGRLQDGETGLPLSGASVTLIPFRDSTRALATLTDTAGRFRFRGLEADSFLIRFSYIGFETIVRGLRVEGSMKNLGLIPLLRLSKELAGVVVRGTTPPATQKGDTVQFNASQFKVNPDASAEDLARKVPGITVENGQVMANGEAVRRVTIDGRELFGDDATAALRNLPAEIIDKIQVFDRLSDQAQLTGFDDGNTTKGINIVTKANMRNGQFGRAYTGYGTDSRYQAGGNATLLKESRRISVVGNFNNINQQNFSQQDLLGVTSSPQRGGGQRGGPRGGGAPRGGGGNFGNSSNFLVGQQAGINRTNAFGINYSDQWGKKATVTGSYFFNNIQNTTDELSNVQFLSGSRLTSMDSTALYNRNSNHRVNMRLEYRIDSANQLIITPNLSFQGNQTERTISRMTAFNPERSRLRQTRSQNLTNSERAGNNLNNGILFRHSFPRRGRSFSINLNTSYNQRKGDSYITAFQETVTNGGEVSDTTTERFTDQFNQGYQVSTNLNYTEPLSANSQLQFSYNPSFSRSSSDQEVFGFNPAINKYSIFMDSLSNQFQNRITAQNGGLSYRWGGRDRQVSFGANYQHTNLRSDQVLPRPLQVNKSFNNILPNARVQYKISPKSTVRLFYRSNVNQPSVTQLQGVLNPNNAPYFSIGNPELDQQYTHSLSSQYTFTNTGKGILLMGNIFLQSARNYIANAVFVPRRDTLVAGDTLLAGSQLTKPVNLDGYASLRSFATFAVPLKFIKSNLNLNTAFSMNRLPGIFENEAIETRNFTYTAGAVVSSNISEFVDFTVSYSGNFNQVRSTNTKARANNDFYSHRAGVQMNLLSKGGWFLQNDLNNQVFSGLTQGFNQNYLLWNAGIGKKFGAGRKGELRLNVFDLLKQNQSITRNIDANSIEDVRNQVLQQYFMLTFTYNLRNFGKTSARRGGSQPQQPREPALQQ